ncbi:MAG: PfkB family carbohydrate kinase, partial [Candidatus Devosia euplotis]|nr:PfkB family carbohydrate kinase [Candidatus Devosia euplotis]
EAFAVLAARLLAAGARYVLLKNGDKGCLGAGPNGEMVSLPAHAVAVLDPTGAGDCFCATLVALMASGNSTSCRP